MADQGFWKRLLEVKWFALVIGLAVFGIVAAVTFGTVLISNLELKILDANFRLKNTINSTRVQEGVSVVQANPKQTPDILIVGIDEKSLDRFGRWPFPRYREADLLDAFSRIGNQEERERALFLDVFFTEPDTKSPENDAMLVSSIAANGRVFLETVLSTDASPAGTEEERLAVARSMAERLGTFQHIVGDWTKVSTFAGERPPLLPYAQVAGGYGHASFLEDDDQIYRRQPLVAKVPELVAEVPLDELTVDYPLDRANFERLAWIDRDGITHDVPYPLSRERLEDLREAVERSAPPRAEDTNNDGTAELQYFVVRHYRDHFVPSITLSLALAYLHRSLADVEVVLGKYILVPSPERYNVETGGWEPYSIATRPAELDADGNIVRPEERRTLTELRIPIDAQGRMLINFLGPGSSSDPQKHQTFPERPFSGYAASPPPADPARWPATKKVGGDILMVGAFSQGMAEDQKTTPFGLMFGVEIHANALNTMLMDNFLHYAPDWLTLAVLFALVMLIAFMASRLPPVASLFATLGILLLYALAVPVLFDFSAYILTFTAPILGAILSLVGVMVYGYMTEGRDKKRIREAFGKYVHPTVVEDLMVHPPELGGVDKQLTVFFSDIRHFTDLSERMQPQELVNHLNGYLTAMTDIIIDYLGTLDKYVGDEIMCFWGAPKPQPEHALLACKCALKQMEVLAALNAHWPEERRLDIGIGINTGIMTVGNMGSLGHMGYTAMGDSVNLGARLEGTNKMYYDPEQKAGHYSRIIISEYTYAEVKDQVIARELDNIRVKGKSRPVTIYELIDMKGGLEPPKPATAARAKALAAAAAEARQKAARAARAARR